MRSFLRGCAWPLSAFPNVFLVLFRKNALFLPLWCPQTAASLASVIQYYHRCSAPPLCSTWNAAAPICNVEFSSGRSLSSLEPDGPLFVCVFLSETAPLPRHPSHHPKERSHRPFRHHHHHHHHHLTSLAPPSLRG